MIVHDLLSKKNITVKITQDSQMHQLPAEMAQRLAARLKRTAGGAANNGTASNGTASNGTGSPAPANGGNASGNGQGGQGSGGAASGEGAAKRPGGPPDLQQMLNHMPAVSFNDLHKGEAVVILSTLGTDGTGTAITLLTGVEPILQAAPNASGASILSPWSLGAPGGDSGGP